MRLVATGCGPGFPTRTAGSSGARRPAAAAVLAGVVVLSGCASLGSGPAFVPDAPASPAASAPAPPPDESDRLTALYAEVEGELTATGRMRREWAPSDAPYTIDDLVRNFEKVALYDEYVDVGGRYVREESEAFLRRWDRPVRVAVMTSPAVADEETARDRANVAAFTSRLARLTGLDMRISPDAEPNFLILFMDSAEQAVFAREVLERYPNFAPAVANAIGETTADTFCTAYAFSDGVDKARYSAVMILIRAEHPPLTRLSCVQEEMAQAMGLPNDSPEARPSLFNDSLEFALLTEHDEILLRMLYDPRLRPGMTIEEAHPLLHDVARDAIAAEKAEQGGVQS
jgi:hypothetical protein